MTLESIGPLELARMTVRTARAEPARVFLPAVVIFSIDACSTTLFTEISADHHGIASVAGIVAFMFATLGLTFYSGLLEQLVGAVERGLPAPPVLEVLRTMPYGRLLAADALLWLLDGVASLAFVVPGLVATTLFALVGPVITTQGTTVVTAFQRSARLVAPRFVLVLCCVTIPLAVENEVVTTAALLVHHENLGLVFLSHAVMGFCFGVALGLMEVSLAERLLHGAHGPVRASGATVGGLDSAPGDGAPLRSADNARMSDPTHHTP